MEQAFKFFVVLGLGAVELWAAVPAGLALNLHPVLVGVATAVGALGGAFVIVLFGERVRARLVREPGKEKGRYKRLHRIWTRYGVIGWGLLAPLLTGAPLGVALGVAFGAPAARLLLWAGVGIVLWTTGLTIAGALGLAGIEALRR